MGEGELMPEMFARIPHILAAAGVPHRLHDHTPVRTGAEAQALLGFPEEADMKTVAFRAGERWVLVSTFATSRVDYKKLAAALGVKRDALRLPAPEDVERALGYTIGGVAPFPPDDSVTVLFDDAITAHETVYCGAGRPGRTLEIAPADLIAVSGGRVVDIAR